MRSKWKDSSLTERIVGAQDQLVHTSWADCALHKCTSSCIPVRPVGVSLADHRQISRPNPLWIRTLRPIDWSWSWPNLVALHCSLTFPLEPPIYLRFVWPEYADNWPGHDSSFGLWGLLGKKLASIRLYSRTEEYQSKPNCLSIDVRKQCPITD